MSSFSKKVLSSFSIGSALLELIVFFSSRVLRNFIWFDEFSFTAVSFFVMSLIFAICSRKTPKPNETFGIRIAATIDYPEVWPIVHSFYSLAVTGLLPAQLMLIFYLRGWIRFLLCVVFVILPILIAVTYANVIVKPYEKKADDELKEQLYREQFLMYKK